MDRLTMAQAVGEESIPEGIVWFPEEMQEWFGDDLEFATAQMDFEKQSRIARLESELHDLRSERESFAGYVDGWN